MSTKRLHYLIPYLILILFFLATNCNEQSVTPQEDIYSKYTKAQLDSLTMASLKKVDNHPFYTMIYYGDYGFSNYVKPGVNKSALLKTNTLLEKFSLRFKNSKIISNQRAKVCSEFNSKIVNVPGHIRLWRDLRSKIKIDLWSCTCFAALGNKNATILGRNFDWYDHIPLLLFTDPPDGYASVSMVDLDYFGFNRNNLPDKVQNNRRLLDTPWLPFDGMNERGVAIGMMAIDHAEPPSDPSKKTIGEIEVLRLVLDYAKSTEHAIELIKKYNVRIETPPIHYLIADSSGHSAIIEFVGGKMIVMSNSQPWQVSTNFIIHGSGAPENANCWRYNRAYNTLKENKGKLATQEAMNLLQSVSQSSTIWSMVYQLNSGRLNAVVGRNFANFISFELKNK